MSVNLHDGKHIAWETEHCNTVAVVTEVPNGLLPILDTGEGPSFPVMRNAARLSHSVSSQDNIQGKEHRLTSSELLRAVVSHTNCLSVRQPSHSLFDLVKSEVPTLRYYTRE